MKLALPLLVAAAAAATTPGELPFRWDELTEAGRTLTGVL